MLLLPGGLKGPLTGERCWPPTRRDGPACATQTPTRTEAHANGFIGSVEQFCSPREPTRSSPLPSIPSSTGPPAGRDLLATATESCPSDSEDRLGTARQQAGRCGETSEPGSRPTDDPPGEDQ
jgi:hypothetical protein